MHVSHKSAFLNQYKCFFRCTFCFTGLISVEEMNSITVILVVFLLVVKVVKVVIRKTGSWLFALTGPEGVWHEMLKHRSGCGLAHIKSNKSVSSVFFCCLCLKDN